MTTRILDRVCALLTLPGGLPPPMITLRRVTSSVEVASLLWDEMSNSDGARVRTWVDGFVALSGPI